MSVIRGRGFAWLTALLIPALASGLPAANAQTGKWPEGAVRAAVAAAVAGGEFLSYGERFLDSYRLVAAHVDKLAHGVKSFAVACR